MESVLYDDDDTTNSIGICGYVQVYIYVIEKKAQTPNTNRFRTFNLTYKSSVSRSSNVLCDTSFDDLRSAISS